MIDSTLLQKCSSCRRPTAFGVKGFTLVELMIGLLISAIVIIVSLQVLVAERRSSEARKQERNAQQNLRVAMDNLSREVRMAGLGIDEFNSQPKVVDAGPWTLSFNADISTGIGGKAAMFNGSSFVLANGTSYSPGDYPYENLGDLTRYNGGAETVTFGLDANMDGVVDDNDLYSESENPIDFALFRRMNDEDPDRLAFGIRGPEAYPDGTLPDPLFTYWGVFAGDTLSLWGDTDGNGELNQGEIGALTPVSIGYLPKVIYVDLEVASFTEGQVARMGHVHGSGGDPFNYLEMGGTTRVRPRNFGVNPAGLDACGAPPAAPSGVWVEDAPNDAGASILVHFNASVDEESGEEDVTHYFVYRRQQGEGYGAAIGQVLAIGLSTYTWANDIHTPDEANIPEDGVNYYYRITAWDCKPQESNMSSEAGPMASMPNGVAPPEIIAAYDMPCDSGEQISVIFNQSPDEPGGTVTGYKIYRGPQSGDILTKTYVGYAAANGSPVYVWNDMDGSNIAGAPPIDGTEYWYSARAYTDTIASVDSNELGPVVSNAGLSAALLVEVTDVPNDEGEALKILWRRSLSEQCIPSKVENYFVQRRDPGQEAFSTVQIVVPTLQWEYDVVDDGLTQGEIYTYRIMTMGEPEGVPSNEMSATPTANEYLLPPTNVIAEGVECDPGGAIFVSWTASDHDTGSGVMDSYRVWRRVEGADAYSLHGVVPAIGADNYDYYDDDGGGNPPVLGTTYEYVVTSLNQSEGIESDYSNMAPCTSSAVPGAPTLLSAGDTPDDHGSSITLVFARSEDDGGCTNTVIGYKIFRSQVYGSYPDPSIGWISSTGQESYTFYDQGQTGNPPIDGTPYYYMVRAFDGTEDSDDSNQLGPVISEDNVGSVVTVFYDGFESDLDWKDGGDKNDWERKNPDADDCEYGLPDPEDAFLGDKVQGNDHDGEYDNNADNWLRTPELDFTGYSGIRISFQRWLNIDLPVADWASIEVSLEHEKDGPWTTIWQSTEAMQADSWTEVGYDLGWLVDDQPTVWIRFRLVTDGSNKYGGWNIDEFRIFANE